MVCASFVTYNGSSEQHRVCCNAHHGSSSPLLCTYFLSYASLYCTNDLNGHLPDYISWCSTFVIHFHMHSECLAMGHIADDRFFPVQKDMHIQLSGHLLLKQLSALISLHSAYAWVKKIDNYDWPPNSSKTTTHSCKFRNINDTTLSNLIEINIPIHVRLSQGFIFL